MSINTDKTTKSEDGTEFPWTAPTDVRFPNCNITRYCFQMFYDYQRCSRLLGKSHKGCIYFQKAYTSLCPHVWVAKWHDQLEEGTFPLDLPEEKDDKKTK